MAKKTLRRIRPKGGIKPLFSSNRFFHPKAISMGRPTRMVEWKDLKNKAVHRAKDTIQRLKTAIRKAEAKRAALMAHPWRD